MSRILLRSSHRMSSMSSKYTFILTSALFSSVAVGERKLPRLGISFSPAGLLTPFHIGAGTCLNDVGCLPEEVALAGASGGALAAVTTALLMNYPPSTLPMSPLEASVYVAQQCRDFGARGTLRMALDDVLAKLLPADSHEQLNKRQGSVNIAFASFSRENGFRAQLVNNFYNKEDLIDCLRASCNIPFYFNGNSLFVDVRGESAVDGFFSVDLRRFGCPSTLSTERELIVCPFAPPYVNLQPQLLRPESSQCQYDFITPALLDKEHWPFSFPEVLKMALKPPSSSTSPSQPISDEELREKYGVLFRAGYEAARRWYELKGQYVWRAEPSVRQELKRLENQHESK